MMYSKNVRNLSTGLALVVALGSFFGSPIVKAAKDTFQARTRLKTPAYKIRKDESVFLTLTNASPQLARFRFRHINTVGTVERLQTFDLEPERSMRRPIKLSGNPKRDYPLKRFAISYEASCYMDGIYAQAPMISVRLTRERKGHVEEVLHSSVLQPCEPAGVTPPSDVQFALQAASTPGVEWWIPRTGDDDDW